MNVAPRFIEVHQSFEEGYHSQVDYGAWRVATLRYLEELAPENIEAMERHNETDEVFVLLQGRCILFLGEGEGVIETIHPVEMSPHKMYNIKKGVYHTHTLSPDALLLIVENRDTGSTNSDRLRLTEEHREQLVACARMLGLND